MLAFLAVAGGVLMAAGAATPFRENDIKLFHTLHNTFSLCGAVLSMLAVTYIKAQYCAANKKSAMRIAVSYGIFCVVVIFVYALIRCAALFEAGAPLCFFVVMYLLNRNFVYKDNSILSFQPDAQGCEPAVVA